MYKTTRKKREEWLELNDFGSRSFTSWGCSRLELLLSCNPNRRGCSRITKWWSRENRKSALSIEIWIHLRCSSSAINLNGLLSFDDLAIRSTFDTSFDFSPFSSTSPTLFFFASCCMHSDSKSRASDESRKESSFPTNFCPRETGWSTIQSSTQKQIGVQIFGWSSSRVWRGGSRVSVRWKW